MKKWLSSSYLAFMVMLVGCGGASIENPNTNDNTDNNQGENSLTQLNMNLEINNEVENSTSFLMTLKNIGEKDVELLFNSGQQIEIIVTDDQNNKVYQFSEGMSFTQALQKMVVEKNKIYEWAATWEHNSTIEAGTYHVMAKITASQINERQLEPSDLTVTKDFDMEKSSTTTTTIPDNNAFRKIVVTGDHLVFTISGEARVYEGVYQYEVKENGVIFQNGTETVAEGAPTWYPFTLSFDLTNQVSSSSTIEFELFVYSAKDGSKAEIITIPLN